MGIINSTCNGWCNFVNGIEHVLGTVNSAANGVNSASNFFTGQNNAAPNPINMSGLTNSCTECHTVLTIIIVIISLIIGCCLFCCILSCVSKLRTLWWLLTCCGGCCHKDLEKGSVTYLFILGPVPGVPDYNDESLPQYSENPVHSEEEKIHDKKEFALPLFPSFKGLL